MNWFNGPGLNGVQLAEARGDLSGTAGGCSTVGAAVAAASENARRSTIRTFYRKGFLFGDIGSDLFGPIEGLALFAAIAVNSDRF